MRDVFIESLFHYAKEYRNIIIITGDLGFGVLDRFQKELPTQYINAGVAEQNMTGLATGLALEGKIVFTYSIGNFPTFRCLEQIRNDVLYHDVPVNVVSVGGGFSYGPLGMSHHATEDIGVLRALPGLRIIAPCDQTETKAAIDLMIREPIPTYLRLDKSKVAEEFCSNVESIKYPREILSGDQILFLGYGGILKETIEASKMLRCLGFSSAVYSVPLINPIDRFFLLNLVKKYDYVITVEEHVRTGGLGSLLADLFLDSGWLPKGYESISLPNKFSTLVGSQEYLRMCYGLNSKSIYDRAIRLLNANS